MPYFSGLAGVAGAGAPQPLGLTRLPRQDRLDGIGQAPDAEAAIGIKNPQHQQRPVALRIGR